MQTTDYRHRTCHVCGKDWNVSAKTDSDKHYTCPRCRAKNKPKTPKPTRHDIFM
jgi:DNA-directed RNA polymerase subunit RPC12/RpoP